MCTYSERALAAHTPGPPPPSAPTAPGTLLTHRHTIVQNCGGPREGGRRCSGQLRDDACLYSCGLRTKRPATVLVYRDSRRAALQNTCARLSGHRRQPFEMSRARFFLASSRRIPEFRAGHSRGILTLSPDLVGVYRQRRCHYYMVGLLGARRCMRV